MLACRLHLLGRAPLGHVVPTHQPCPPCSLVPPQPLTGPPRLHLLPSVVAPQPLATRPGSRPLHSRQQQLPLALGKRCLGCTGHERRIYRRKREEKRPIGITARHFHCGGWFLLQTWFPWILHVVSSIWNHGSRQGKTVKIHLGHLCSMLVSKSFFLFTCSQKRLYYTILYHTILYYKRRG